MGPFISILGSVINDTMKFAFLFFEFFIPYTVGFWILFGKYYFIRECANFTGIVEYIMDISDIDEPSLDEPLATNIILVLIGGICSNQAHG